MQKAGFDQQLDPRSGAEQGVRIWPHSGEKTLQGMGVRAGNAMRRSTPCGGCGRSFPRLILVEKFGERQVAAVEEREGQEPSRLDKLIAAARELAVEVKEGWLLPRRVLSDGMEQFRGAV